MITICDKDLCTDCGVCQNICPVDCIQEQFRLDGSRYCVKQEKKCISCMLCEKVCPNITKTDVHFPLKAYAAWSPDREIHHEAATGGIASSIYAYAADHNNTFFGVEMNNHFEAHFAKGKQKSDIERFRNSKYTFSFMDDIYQQVVADIKEGKKVYFVGLPCQVAAVKNYCKQMKCEEMLITVDLVCHGTPPKEYFEQHMNHLEEKLKCSFKQYYFRDPAFDSGQFIMTVYSEEPKKLVYKKFVKDDDLYQIGYHQAYIYRENCYKCIYANNKRIGDFTCGDYHGLGKNAPYEHNMENVSCLFVNTEKGLSVLDELVKKSYLEVYERPINEPLSHDPQLNHPSVAPAERKEFVIAFEHTKNFDEAAKMVWGKQAVKNGLIVKSHVRDIKKCIKKILKK